VVVLNAGAALFLAGEVRSLAEGLAVAGDTIDRGRAARTLEQLVTISSAEQADGGSGG
jgi:anthranilate phosphoribosyltransferase